MAGTRLVIGIDEVGRGPLAGPVTVCAYGISVRANRSLKEQRDSKRLSPEKRKFLAAHYRSSCGAIYALASVSSRTIDQIGIERATLRAVALSLKRLHIRASEVHVLLDGRLRAPNKYSQETIVHGDETVPLIAIASIIAKVHRDTLMKQYAKKYPKYGFEEHVGYGTKSHYRALRRFGPSPIHRRSFITAFHSLH